MIKRNIINVLLILGLIFVVSSSLKRTQHGDKAEWIKQHGEIANRRQNPEEFCIKCHTEKYNQTKGNFCNACHSSSNVELLS